MALSRQDLASYTGTTYETVFRMIQELVEAKHIKTEGKEVRILDIEGLRKLTVIGE